MPSVMREWTHDLPLREQGTLVSGLRGCDVVPKQPLDSTPRQLVAWLRYVTMNPTDSREVGVPGAYMLSHLPPAPRWRQSEFGHFPLHFVSHLMHAFEVVAYRHPDAFTRATATDVYLEFVRGLHLRPESRDEMIARLSEDRVATNSIVS